MQRMAGFALALLIGSAAAAAPGTSEMTGNQEHALRNCPSAVAGSITTIANRKDGIALDVTAKDPAAQSEIRARARRQATISLQPARGALEHTGEGTGSGTFGYCPGMQQGTVVSVDDLADGARLRVRARRAADVVPLQKSARARLQTLTNER